MGKWEYRWEKINHVTYSYPVWSCDGDFNDEDMVKKALNKLEAEKKRFHDGITSLLRQVNEAMADGGETIILASVRDGLAKLVGEGRE